MAARTQQAAAMALVDQLDRAVARMLPGPGAGDEGSEEAAREWCTHAPGLCAHVQCATGPDAVRAACGCAPPPRGQHELRPGPGRPGGCPGHAEEAHARQ